MNAGLKTAAGMMAALAWALPHAATAQVVKVDGSSTVYPVTEGVAEDFQKLKRGAVKVTVGVSGTGGGFKKFCRADIEVSNASRPISKKEMEDCKGAGVEYFELPVAFDALTVVVNPRNAFIKQLTVEELKKLWEPEAQGKVTHWNQVNPSFPNAPLKQKTHLPIVIDPSHGTGHTNLVTAMARASIAAGADGIIVEVHPNPDKAMSDGYQSLNFPQFEEMMRQCRRIAAAMDRELG
jgi:phosphate binding protein